MHRTLLEELFESELPKPDFKYVGPAEIEVKTCNPRWTWITRICSDIPSGKCVMFPVPNGINANTYALNLRSALHMGRLSKFQRFSVRRAKNEKYVVVLKAETWADYYRRMEGENSGAALAVEDAERRAIAQSP